MLLIYNSTASDKEKNLKCSAPFKQEASPWWQAGGFVTCFSSAPCCTHTRCVQERSSKKKPHTGSELSSATQWNKCPAPPPRVRSTDHERQNHSETSLLQIAVISHPSSARLTLPGPQGPIYSIRFGLRVPKLWLRRQSKRSAAVSRSPGKWWKCQSRVALLC